MPQLSTYSCTQEANCTRPHHPPTKIPAPGPSRPHQQQNKTTRSKVNDFCTTHGKFGAALANPTRMRGLEFVAQGGR